MTELSIIFPTHNEGSEFVRETINSIKLTIDIENYEIIVIDDGSDKPISGIEIGNHVYCKIQNQGVGAAFDTGMK